MSGLNGCEALTQDDLLARAVKMKRSSHKKVQPGAWIKKVFSSKKNPQNNQTNTRPTQRQSLVAIGTRSGNRHPLPQSQRPRLRRRASAPCLQKNHLARSSRCSRTFEERNNESMPQKGGFGSSGNRGDNDRVEDGDDMDNFNDPLEIVTSDLDYGVSGAGDLRKGPVSSFTSEYYGLVEEAEDVKRSGKSSDYDDTVDQRPARDEAVEMPGPKDNIGGSHTEIDFESAHNGSKTKDAPLLETEQDATSVTYPETISVDVSELFEVVELPRKNKKKTLDNNYSARDVTESTADLDLSSSEWTAGQDDPLVTNVKKANYERKKNNTKNPVIAVVELKAGHHEEVVESAREQAKQKSEHYFEETDAIVIETRDIDQEGEVGEPKRSKVAKLKSTTAIVVEDGLDQVDETLEVSLFSQNADAVSEERSKKSKRKSRKSIFMLEAADDEVEGAPDAENEPAAREKSSKKSKRKSRKMKVLTVMDKEGMEATDRGQERAFSEELLANTIMRKNKRATIQESTLQGDARMVLDPTSIHQMEPDDMSTLTEVTAGNEDNAAKEGEKIDDRKSSNQMSTRMSGKGRGEQNPPEDGISLSTLLDDVANTRNKLQDLLELVCGKTNEMVTLSQKVLHFLEKMLDCFTEVSNALELIVTFEDCGPEGKRDMGDAREAMTCISDNYAPLLNYLWKVHLQPTMEGHWQDEIQDEELLDSLYRVALILKALTAQFRDYFFERGGPASDLERNRGTKKIFVTLFELLRLEAFAVGSFQGNDEATTFQPSVMLQNAWGVTAQSQIWHEVYQKVKSPLEFRRACIRFVVSESDEPKICRKAMASLLDYCELKSSDLLFDTSPSQSSTKQSSSALDPIDRIVAAVPKPAKLVLKNIKGVPLPREEILKKILFRVLPNGFSNASQASVLALQGRPGVGKTTLAALIAHHGTVREYYCDGIIWISLGPTEELTYARYIAHLSKILRQFSDPVDFEHQSVVHIPGESEAERYERERKCMAFAKAKVATFLEPMRVLVVLDHVSNGDDLEWFCFGSEGKQRRSTTLMTTRSRGLVEDVNVVCITKLDEEKDAAWLLHRDCNTTNRELTGRVFEMSARSFFESDVVKAMVKACCMHPMAVASLGRFICLHSQQNNLKAQKSLVLTGMIFAEFKLSGGIAALIEVLNLSLSPTASGVPARVIRLCLVAFVTVFCKERALRDHVGDAPYPRVPVEITELLFESVLVLDDEDLKWEELFYQHKANAVKLIHNVLCVLGILAYPARIPKRTTYLTHHIYGEYVKNLIDTDTDIAQFVTHEGKGLHRAFVSHLLDSADKWEPSDCRHAYAAATIPFHMICAEMFVEAGDMLANREFTTKRITCLGLQAAAKRHVNEVHFLLEKLVPGPREARVNFRTYYTPVIQAVYQSLVDAITTMEDEAVSCFDEGEVSMALLDIGMSFSEWQCYEDAIGCWMASLPISSMSVAERCKVMFNVGVAYEELGQLDEALTFQKKCLGLQRISQGDSHVSCAGTLCRIGDLLITQIDYSAAVEAYKEALEILKVNSTVEGVECCVAVADVHYMLGRVYYRKKEYEVALQYLMSALQSKKQKYGKKSPSLTPIFVQIGICLLDLGRKSDAKEAFERSLALAKTGDEEKDFSNPDFLIPHGVLTGMQRKKKVSRKYFDMALEVLRGDNSKHNEWRLSFVTIALELFRSKETGVSGENQESK